MGIDFFAESNKYTYAGRRAHETWKQAVQELVSVAGCDVVDIGCGGGIYSRALAELGAASVIGVDASPEMLGGAAESCRGLPAVSFRHGTAAESGLPEQSADLVFMRAVTHHIAAAELPACFREARRILRPGGALFVQNRTPDDCLRPGTATHIRGFFFQLFPSLIEKETARRHDSMTMRRAFAAAGFGSAAEVKLWETRREYGTREELREDVLQRTGRSLLHELTDEEVRQLADYIAGQVPETHIQETDCWTIWLMRKED